MLYACRAEAGLNQRQLERKAGLCLGQVSRYEAGKRVPTVRSVLAIIDALAPEPDREAWLWLMACMLPPGTSFALVLKATTDRRERLRLEVVAQQPALNPAQ